MSEEPVTVEGSAEEEPSLEDAVAAAAEKAGLEKGEADQFKPPAGELVVAPGRDIYRVMDRHDEVQILDELQSRPIKEMVYSFTQAGAKVTDLSYGGVREVVRTLNRERYTAIRIANAVPPQVEEFSEEGESYYRVMVYAEDLATGQGQWGTATEPKHMALKAGGTKWDKFALTKALNKAQRNAMKACIPLEFIEVIKAQFLGDHKKVREIQAGPGAEAMAELPPPLSDERSEKLREECRVVFDEIKKVDRLKVLPSGFNRMMMRAEWSHERLEEMVAHLRETLDEVLREKAA